MSTKETVATSGEAFWTVAQVMAYLSMSKSWVYKQAELGLLPCARFGASLRFNPAAIRRYAEQCSRAAAPAAKVVPLHPAE